MTKSKAIWFRNLEGKRQKLSIFTNERNAHEPFQLCRPTPAHCIHLIIDQRVSFMASILVHIITGKSPLLNTCDEMCPVKFGLSSIYLPGFVIALLLYKVQGAGLPRFKQSSVPSPCLSFLPIQFHFPPASRCL